jgi:hypothetical protein
MHIHSSTLMVDSVQKRSYALSPARRILFGAILCFLAALFAVEVKVAWVANAGTSPNDYTAAKLCPVAGKLIEQKLHSSVSSENQSKGLLQLAVITLAFALPIRKFLQQNYPPTFSGICQSHDFSAFFFYRPPPTRI